MNLASADEPSDSYQQLDRLQHCRQQAAAGTISRKSQAHAIYRPTTTDSRITWADSIRLWWWR